MIDWTKRAKAIFSRGSKDETDVTDETPQPPDIVGFVGAVPDLIKNKTGDSSVLSVGSQDFGKNASTLKAATALVQKPSAQDQLGDVKEPVMAVGGVASSSAVAADGVDYFHAPCDATAKTDETLPSSVESRVAALVNAGLLPLDDAALVRERFNTDPDGWLQALALFLPTAPPSISACRSCAHRTKPGLTDPGYCGGGRPGLTEPYGPEHPLRHLPADAGVNCAYWNERK